MNRRYILPFLAFLGAILGLCIVIWTQKTVPVPPILFPPPTSPYPSAIAGAGIIEASSENISVGSPFNEVVDAIFVTEGDYVNAGDPLLQLDLRNFSAQVAIEQANVKAAFADLDDKRKQFSFYERLADKHAVSEQTYEQYRYALLQSQEALNVAEKNLEAAQTNIERSIIRAPIAGKILQVNIHVGELASASPFVATQGTWQNTSQLAMILMGAVNPLQVRVDIDEADAWRYQKGSRATAFVRGNSRINFPLQFHLVEPYVIPKSSFTGETVERVDTRVLQVLYRFDKGDLPVYPGQVLDIFVESEPLQAWMPS